VHEILIEIDMRARAAAVYVDFNQDFMQVEQGS
jgi:hypothetical protein